MGKRLYVIYVLIAVAVISVGCGKGNDIGLPQDVTPSLASSATPTLENTTKEPEKEPDNFTKGPDKIENSTREPDKEGQEAPTIEPTQAPEAPTKEPTIESTKAPTSKPPVEPTKAPTSKPPVEPTKAPTKKPTAEPTKAPTKKPTAVPTVAPTKAATNKPTVEPTKAPTKKPTAVPTKVPTNKPTVEPTKAPTNRPTKTPTKAPLEIVDYVEESKSKTTDFKYGVKKVVTTVTCYNVYSDGSKKVDYTYSYNDYDVSGYSATDAELMDETKKVQASNMTYYEEVLDLVNAIRAEVGVPPLVLDVKMCKAATMRALEMDYSGLFSHTRPDGRSCFDVLDTFNIECWGCGENIAAGYGSPKAVVEGWKNSPGHYSNMINEGYTKMGVGRSNQGIGGYGDYWAQLFAG